jgi:hypothetical protein
MAGAMPPRSTLAITLAVLAVSWIGLAVASSEEPSQPPESEETATEGEGTTPAEEDPCAPSEHLGGAWIDALNRRVYRSVCGSARWFDSFFGSRRAFAEAERTYGWISTQQLWSEYDGFDTHLRFRAKVELPNLDQRFKLLVGRLSEEDEVEEARVAEERDFPGPFRNARDEEWLVGLGYSPVSSTRSRMDYSVGVNTRWPPEPYAKARYRHLVFLDDNRLMRLRQTLFWRELRGFGTTSAVDYDVRLGQALMLRLSTTGTITEVSPGVEYWSSATLYEGLGSGRGMAYRLWVEGASDDRVPVHRYGVRVTYRQSIFRDWLFGEVATIVSWPRYELDEERRPSWGIGIGVDMYFGSGP